MNTLNSSLYAVAIMVCALCSYIVRGAANPQRHVYLAGFLVLESLAFLCEWLMLHPTSPGKSLWLGSLMSISLLLGPCLWLYAREIAGQRVSPGALPYAHLAVVVCGMLLTLPLIETSHLGPDYANPNRLASPQHSLLIHGTMLLSVSLFLVQVPYYLSECLRTLRGPTGNGSFFAGVDSPPLRALRLLMFVLAANWFVGLLRTVHCLVLGKDTGLGTLFAFLEVAVTVWATFTLLKRSPVASADPLPAVGPGDPSPGPDRKYARSSLDGPARSRIRRKLQEALTLRRVHCESGLGLRKLCQQIRENPHYVSQVINEDLATSFHDLINHHRIEDAKHALASATDRTIMEICVETGFNSKSTFNAAFREHTGMTPTEYRKQLRDSR